MTKDTKIKLEILVGRGFILNRLWDRALSVFNVKYSMNNFEKIYHNGLAHRFPIDWSDFISDILTENNEITRYEETPVAKEDYTSLVEFFEKNLEEHMITNEILSSAIITANVNKEYGVEVKLKEFQKILTKYINQARLLLDKSKQMEMYIFDHLCEDFYIL